MLSRGLGISAGCAESVQLALADSCTDGCCSLLEQLSQPELTVRGPPADFSPDRPTPAPRHTNTPVSGGDRGGGTGAEEGSRGWGGEQGRWGGTGTEEGKHGQWRATVCLEISTKCAFAPGQHFSLTVLFISNA